MVKLLKGEILLSLLVIVYAVADVSCKKSNNSGPFVTPTVLPVANVGVYSFVAAWDKDGPASAKSGVWPRKAI